MTEINQTLEHNRRTHEINESNPSYLLTQVLKNIQELKTLSISITESKDEQIIAKFDSIIQEFVSSLSLTSQRSTEPNYSLIPIPNPETTTENQRKTDEKLTILSITPNNAPVLIMRPEMSVYECDYNDLVGRRLFGTIFHPDAKWILPAFYTTQMMCNIGMGLYCLAQWNVIPHQYLYCTILCYPAYVFAILTLNIPIFKVIFFDSTRVIIEIWSMIYLAGMIALFWHHDHFGIMVAGLFFHYFGFTVLTLGDAFPLAMRHAEAKYAMPCVFPMLCLIWISLYFNWMKVDKDSFIEFLGNIKISPSGLAASAVENMALYFINFMYTVHKNKDRMIILKTRMFLAKITQEKLEKIQQFEKEAKITTEKIIQGRKSIKIHSTKSIANEDLLENKTERDQIVP